MRPNPNDIDMLLGMLEPAAHAVYGRLPDDIVAKYSIAVSMKRIADFLHACGERIETDVALSEKSNGSEH